jgi:hypothetical protein
VRKWEYRKIALNEAPRRGDDIDLLCDAGETGWELVAVLPNGVSGTMSHPLHSSSVSAPRPLVSLFSSTPRSITSE